MTRHASTRWTPTVSQSLWVAIAILSSAAVASAQLSDPGSDPRVGLAGGHWIDAGEAISNLNFVAHKDRPTGYFNPADRGDLAVANTDITFRDNFLFQGNGRGVMIWDISDPANPTLRSATVCPGGQGDVSVYGNLLFVSTEGLSGRIDCGAQGVMDTVSADRMRGVRIYDISDIDHPKQVAAVQTCRGSHTNTVVPDPVDKNVVYVYVQGISRVRPTAELAGCSGLRPEQDPNTSLFRIEVIRVPLNAPQDAKVVSTPRLFADAKTGAVNGLAKANPGDTLAGVQKTAETNQCHDITVYPALGLGAGACSGNGILIDIRNPAEPKRIAEVSDPNFAYWHSATFSNDGSRIIFTDEWGGGWLARCRATDPPKWGADAIFTLTSDRKFQLDGYYKLSAPQSAQENCVAHNGSLIPVPGRDILVQGWYQGGVSVFDFTDPAHPKEIAYFDRGPLDANKLLLGGSWGAYWYNGHIYSSDIGRGLDVFTLKPSQDLTQNEIDAANLVHLDIFNPTTQPRITWPASFVVARAYLDQLERTNGLAAEKLATVKGELDRVEHLDDAQRGAALRKLAKQVAGDAKGAQDAERVRSLAASITDLANPAGERRAGM
jgi:hypothetical protein